MNKRIKNKKAKQAEEKSAKRKLIVSDEAWLSLSQEEVNIYNKVRNTFKPFKLGSK